VADCNKFWLVLEEGRGTCTTKHARLAAAPFRITGRAPPRPFASAPRRAWIPHPHGSPCREVSSRSPWWEGPCSARRWPGPLNSRKTTEWSPGTVCAVRPVIMIDRVIWMARRAVARVAARRLRRRVARLRVHERRGSLQLRHGSAVGGVLLLWLGNGRRDDYRGRSPCRGPCQPMRGALGAPHYDPGGRGSAEARTATAFPRQRSDLSRPHFLRLFFFGGGVLHGIRSDSWAAPPAHQPESGRRGADEQEGRGRRRRRDGIDPSKS
jgi:hypothetical protein